MIRHDYDIDDTSQQRIQREVIIVDAEQEGDEIDDTSDEEYDEEEDVEEERNMPWLIITTGKMLTDGSLPHHRYFIAIALMCFFSIFLTFMSLNADREYRQRELYASILHERAVLKEEERYGLSSKSAVTSRLKQHGIELIDLSKNSRLIEK